MRMHIHITNNTLPPGDFNTLCFYLGVSHDGRRVADGFLMENISVELERHYREMGRTATTEEYYRYMIRRISERALSFTGCVTVDASIELHITYTEKERTA